MLFIHFIIAFAIFFPITLFVITLFRAYQEDGNPININLFFLLLLISAFLFTSCTKEDSNPPLCPGGCNATIDIELDQDINGYYIVPSDVSRFNVIVTANSTDPFYYYNDQSVIEADFNGGLVSDGSIYLGKRANNYSSKKIIGPFVNEMVGDTITITGDVYWDGGSQFYFQEFSFKFIVE